MFATQSGRYTKIYDKQAGRLAALSPTSLRHHNKGKYGDKTPAEETATTEDFAGHCDWCEGYGHRQRFCEARKAFNKQMNVGGDVGTITEADEPEACVGGLTSRDADSDDSGPGQLY